MSNPLVPSFRRPNLIPPAAAHPAIVAAIHSHDNSITDLNQAVAALSAGITTVKTAQSAASSGSSGASETVTIINTTVSGGVVNNQTGVVAYGTQQTDDGALIVLGAVSPIAVTLNASVTLPWFTSISNAGTSTVTVTPAQGIINGNANLTLPAGSWVTVYFDGLNFWAESPGSTAGGVTSIVAGTNVTISPSSGVGAVTVNSTGGGGGGKTRHDVTGSRAYATIYHNTTGVDMWVSGYGGTAGGFTSDLTALVDTVTPPVTVGWGNEYTASVSGGKAGFGFLVPSGNYYELIVGGSGAITSLGLWVEYY